MIANPGPGVHRFRTGGPRAPVNSGRGQGPTANLPYDLRHP